MSKTTVKTTFETINSILSTEFFKQYFTLQDNDINQYCRVCFVDKYAKDNYKVFKDFALYYNRVDSVKISINVDTLQDSTQITDKKTTKKALEFSVNINDLQNIITEIIAQKLLLIDAVTVITEHKTTVKRVSKKKEKAV